MWLSIFVVLLSFGLLLAIQEEDPHQNQPESCNNYHENTHKCECVRTKSCDRKERDDDALLIGVEAMHRRCQLYCKKNKCFCSSAGCTT